MIRLAAALFLFAACGAQAGTPRHAALDGPFSVPTAWTTMTINGQPVQTPTAFSDNHWIATQAFYAACPSLAPYADAVRPLARVWAGDSPASPAQTVPLAFPSAATAETVLLACGATEPSP